EEVARETVAPVTLVDAAVLQDALGLLPDAVGQGEVAQLIDEGALGVGLVAATAAVPEVVDAVLDRCTVHVHELLLPALVVQEVLHAASAVIAEDLLAGGLELGVDAPEGVSEVTAVIGHRV